MIKNVHNNVKDNYQLHFKSGRHFEKEKTGEKERKNNNRT